MDLILTELVGLLCDRFCFVWARAHATRVQAQIICWIECDSMKSVSHWQCGLRYRLRKKACSTVSVGNGIGICYDSYNMSHLLLVINWRKLCHTIWQSWRIVKGNYLALLIHISDRLKSLSCCPIKLSGTSRCIGNCTGAV